MTTQVRRFVVRGRVQGVGFRFFVRRVATDMQLDGWVRNLPDGRTVEAEARGPDSVLDAFARTLREGPPGSFVTEFEETVLPDDGTQPGGFRIR